MHTTLSDIERERLVARILRAAAAMVYEVDWVDDFGVRTAPFELQELAAALDALPLAERARYGV